MHQVKDEPMETIHVYVVREQQERPSLIPLIISLCALSVLLAIGTLTPYQQPVTRASFAIPAVPLAIKSFTASAAILPTGVRTFPATYARGVLTFTNGSIIGQTLPAGFKFISDSGVEVATDSSVFLPAGSADGYGTATVSAHALLSGAHGNLPPLAINQVIGASVYIRNLSAFSGGRDAYLEKFITSNDRTGAASKIRKELIAKIIGLHYPCAEHRSGTTTLTVTWRCQFVTYTVPSYMRVLRVRLLGHNLLVDVVFTPPPVRIWVK